MTNKEAFLKLVSEEDTETVREIKERIEKRKAVMTPKEKAEELLTKMYQPLPASKEAVNGKEHLYYNQWSAAKQCSLIAVEETINTLNYDIRDLDVRGSVLLDLIKYWREVKQEIEKL